jgi:hypothetical protein
LRLIKTSADGKTWQEVAHEKGNNRKFKGYHFTGTFAIAGCGERRFIRLVNIGRNNWGSDGICISGWEIFGSPVE